MMDSSQYYTGATLFRGNKFLQQQQQQQQQQHLQNQQQQQLNLGPPPPHQHQQYGGGPPLLMQPRTPGETRNLKNLFSGMPLIRANSSDGSISKYLGTPPPTPPGVICFQPFYYIQHPPPPPPPPQQHQQQQQQQQQIIHQHKKQQLHHQNQIIHPRDQPKRKNYKALQQINGNGNSHGHQQYQKIPATKQMSCPPNIPVEFNKSKLTNSESSEPIMINSTSLLNLRKSPTLGPIGSPLQNRSKSPSSNTNTNGFGYGYGVSTYNGNSTGCNGSNGLVNGKSFESLLSAEKLQKQNIEEKERSDRLLNFYFYEEHWRPKEPSSGSDSNADDEDSSWGQNSSILPQNSSILELNNMAEDSVQMLSPSSSPSLYQNSLNQAAPTSSNSTGKTQNNQNQSKDLNIETQIVTLANGHRDLEIRLFFPQIVKS